MSRLMGDELQTTQFLFLGGISLEEDTAVTELDGTRMFHAAKLVVGQEHQPVFLERTGNAGVALHPLH